jgi:hypothetical protein
MYDELGITVERAGSEMQWQNGGVEQAWASIHTRSQAMTNAAGLDKGYWYLSDLHAVKLDMGLWLCCRAFDKGDIELF